MILNRGLRWSAQSTRVTRRRRTDLFSARSFTSTAPNGSATSTTLGSRASIFSRTLPVRLRVPNAATVLRYGQSFRLQSTSATVSGAKDTITTDLENTAFAQGSKDPGLLDEAFDLTSIDLSNIPEQIGQLKAMGLNYGYGPTSLAQWILEHVHVLSGTPWWATVALTALLVRIVGFYPSVLSSNNAARMARMAPITKPLVDKMTASSRLGETEQTMKYRLELKRLNKKGGVNMWHSFLPPLIQAPIGFGMFFLLRAMAELPVPAFETGGLLWFSNLTIPDPYFILPVATAGFLHLVLRSGGETGVQNTATQMLRFLSFGLPAITLGFTALFPAALQFSFFITGLLSYLQSMLFRWVPFRNYMNMMPIVKSGSKPSTSSPESDSQFQPQSYQGHIITAPPRPSASATSPAYEPPRSPSVSASLRGKPTLISGLRSQVSSSISSVQESARNTLKSAREMAGQQAPMDGKRTKQQMQQANEYERTRRLEEAKNRTEADRERRALRDARRRRK